MNFVPAWVSLFQRTMIFSIQSGKRSEMRNRPLKRSSEYKSRVKWFAIKNIQPSVILSNAKDLLFKQKQILRYRSE